MQPSQQPSSRPSRQPSSQPTRQPSEQPTGNFFIFFSCLHFLLAYCIVLFLSSHFSHKLSSISSFLCSPAKIHTSSDVVYLCHTMCKCFSACLCILYVFIVTHPVDITTAGQPSRVPTEQPTMQPSEQPTSQPTRQPVMHPTGNSLLPTFLVVFY